MILLPMNMHVDATADFSEADDLKLIAAFNKTPKEVTAENIVCRRFRPWLVSISEEVSATTGRLLDVVDVTARLQQLRKQGRLSR